eukprot:37504-Chlamydomonas_euryale.AAC.10
MCERAANRHSFLDFSRLQRDERTARVILREQLSPPFTTMVLQLSEVGCCIKSTGHQALWFAAIANPRACCPGLQLLQPRAAGPTLKSFKHAVHRRWRAHVRQWARPGMEAC